MSQRGGPFLTPPHMAVTPYKTAPTNRSPTAYSVEESATAAIRRSNEAAGGKKLISGAPVEAEAKARDHGSSRRKQQRAPAAAAGGSGVGGGDGGGGGVAGAAAGGVLRHAVPGGGDHRAGGGQQGGVGEPRRRRQPRPPPLPRLLRQGCDASVLLDSTPGNQAEKDAAPNTSLRGFEVIDSAKARLEQACFQVVSCADLLAFAARDALALVGGNAYQVPSGRRDGNMSSAQETGGNLPPPTASVSQLNQIFGAKGLTQSDMVALSGAHTIGNAHCSSFDSRLYAYGPNGAGQDPSMDPSYLASLTQQCPNQSGADGTVAMDPVTPATFDTNYYASIVAKRGLLASDQALLADPTTAAQVVGYTNSPDTFQADFAAAMVKMGNVGVLTGTAGTIRTNCRVAN